LASSISVNFHGRSRAPASRLPKSLACSIREMSHNEDRWPPLHKALNDDRKLRPRYRLRPTTSDGSATRPRQVVPACCAKSPPYCEPCALGRLWLPSPGRVVGRRCDEGAASVHRELQGCPGALQDVARTICASCRAYAHLSVQTTERALISHMSAECLISTTASLAKRTQAPRLHVGYEVNVSGISLKRDAAPAHIRNSRPASPHRDLPPDRA
jgi:hypothetical protein